MFLITFLKVSSAMFKINPTIYFRGFSYPEPSPQIMLSPLREGLEIIPHFPYPLLQDNARILFI
jgi:hypothetical protein